MVNRFVFPLHSGVNANTLLILQVSDGDVVVYDSIA